jgi:hypothetical protein
MSIRNGIDVHALLEALKYVDQVKGTKPSLSALEADNDHVEGMGRNVTGCDEIYSLYISLRFSVGNLVSLLREPLNSDPFRLVS